ncbi:MAG: ECF-type sigma factor [Wenzhouxiangella sp.]
MSEQADITGLLRAASEGDEQAQGRLLPLLYRELHALAHRQLHGDGKHRTLCTTALVHEAFLRLAGQGEISFRDRAHFLGYSARVMRSIVVDQARRRQAEKHGGQMTRVTWDEQHAGPGAGPDEVIVLDEALENLHAADPRLARVAELRLFGGLGPGECSAVMGLSERTVYRSWRKARAMLGAMLTSLPET